MDYITLLLSIITVVNSALGLLILFSRQKQSSSTTYSVITVTTLSWIFCIIFYRLSSQENILLWTRLLYASASLIASTFLYFTYLFPIEDNLSILKKILIFIPNVIIVLLIIYSNTVIKDAEVKSDSENVIFFGKYYLIYIVYILGYFNYSFYRIFRKYKILSDPLQKRQALFFLTGYFVSATIAFATNLILPWFNYFTLNWLGQASTVFLVTFTFYAIVKHKLFNIKAVAAELFVGLLWVIFLIRTIVSTTGLDMLLNGGILLITIVIGLLLIKSINSEVKAREKIESLAASLETANLHLKELDQQKSEFVSLASHQLRGPLTAIKGYASMLLDDDFGPIDGQVRDAVDKMYQSTQDLVVVVGDYLDVSRIEQGRMKYDFTDFDMKELVATTITELRPNIARAKLETSFDYDSGGIFMVNADQGKIRQVVGNLLDNSIKYTPKGSIHVWLQKTLENKILISISDTGVGIRPEVLPGLFEKFTRAPDASKTNILGTGLGLYVARKMVEAHGGKVWAESPGQDKGSTFHIELKSL